MSISNQSKYWILELFQKELIQLGFNPILIDSSKNPGAGSEPLLKLDKFSVYCDTRSKYTLYQYGFERLLSRVCKSQIKKTIVEALTSESATQPTT